jgi:hypothetical protein
MLDLTIDDHGARGACTPSSHRARAGTFAVGLAALLCAVAASAHDVSNEDAARIAQHSGMQIWLYAVLGAKHMVTGYDHLLFLVGVIFYLQTLGEIARLVSLFALGHSLTLVAGVLGGVHVDPFLVDAVIGFSVAYKGFDNLNGFDLLGGRPNVSIAVFVFGLFHGLGLATKLQQLGLQSDGLVANLLAFNVGVEVGQISALAAIVLCLRAINFVREQSPIAIGVNVGLIAAGFALLTYQLGMFFSLG